MTAKLPQTLVEIMPANTTALAAVTKIPKKKKNWKGISTDALGQMLS